ncbi:hypothetical protein D3C81_1677500 [compost metagenome]
MKQYFEKQIASVVNSNQADPLMFYIVNGKVENRSLSEIDSLEEGFTFIESRTLGVLDLPVFARK